MLRPGGRVLFVDHVIAPPRTLKRVVHRSVTPFGARFCHGCHWTATRAPRSPRRGSPGDDVRMVRVPSYPFGPTGVLLFSGHLPEAPA